MQDDPLSQCVLFIARQQDAALTQDALLDGLPLKGGRLSPGLVERAAQRVGLDTKLARQPLERVSALLLPCVLLLNNDQACLLEALDTRAGTAWVRFPELDMEAQTLSLEKLTEQYAGTLIYLRPALKVGGERVSDKLSGDGGHWFWSVIRRNRRTYRDVLVASLLVNLFALAMPLFVMNVYDRVVPNQSEATLWVLAAGIFIIISADLLLRLLRGWFVELAARRADNRLSARIMERILGMQLSHMPASSGSLVGNVQAFESVRAFCGSMAVTALIDLPFFLLFLAIILLISPWMALPVAIGALGLLLFALSVQQRMHRLASVSGEVSSQRHAGLSESLAALPLLKTLNATGSVQRRWEQGSRFLAGVSDRQRLLGLSVSSAAAFVQQSVSVCLIIIGVYQVFMGNLSQGALIAAYLLSSRAMAPVTQTAALLTQYHQAAAALTSLEEVMHAPQERTPGQQGLRHATLRGEVEFADVSFTYPGSERPALDGVSLRIKPGERVGLLGAAGSGKSTLSNLIAGLYPPDAGQIFIDGINQAQLDPAELRRQLGYLPQEAPLIDASVYENITLGIDHPDRATLKSALRVSGLDTLIGRHAEGLSLEVGENGKRLSGGQRQTVALARTLMSDAPLTLLDEPSSAMDSMLEQHLCRELETWTQGRTLLLSTHRTRLLSMVERLIVLDGGRIIADGPKQAVLDDLSRGRLQRVS